MAPPIEAFPASELHFRVNVLPNGKRKKGGDFDLRKCELLELVQYSCHLEGNRKTREAVIQCEPVVKFFRKYDAILNLYYSIDIWLMLGVSEDCWWRLQLWKESIEWDLRLCVTGKGGEHGS